MTFEFVQGCAARGHGQDFGANGTAAGDVVRCITHYQDFVALQFTPYQSAATTVRNHRQLIPVLMVISKSACFEVFPKSKVAKLDFRAKPCVAQSSAC